MNAKLNSKAIEGGLPIGNGHRPLPLALAAKFGRLVLGHPHPQELFGDLNPIQVLQLGLNVTGAHAPGIERHNLLPMQNESSVGARTKRFTSFQKNDC